MVSDYDEDMDESRTCEVDGLKYHEDYGARCPHCDIWICTNCWADHTQETGHRDSDIVTE